MIKVIHSVYAMNRAGQETLLMNVMRNLDCSNIHFSFLCVSNDAGDYDDEIRRLGGEVYYLNRSLLHKIAFLSSIGTIYSYFKFFRSHPDFKILHIHNSSAFTSFLYALGARFGGCRRIIVHSHNTNSPKPVLHNVFKKLLNLMTIERFSCSELAAEWMFGANASKAHIINNGIILDSFKYDANKRRLIRKELGLSEKDLVIGHIGRFNAQKNHAFLIDIFKEIKQLNPSAKLVLVGDGHMRASVELTVKQLGLNESVLFLGVREDVPSLLSAFDLFLFPSLYEGLAVAMIEVQASGLPSVISDTITKEIVLTPDVTMVSLNAPAVEWAETALRIAAKGDGRDNNIQILRDKGYDIINTVNYLCKKYEELS